MPVALVRRVPETFGNAVRTGSAGPDPDPDLAARQHDDYCRALAAAGYALRSVDADPAMPDCPFVEDTAVILGEIALVTRPGHPSRRGETSAVADALTQHFEVVTMEPPATLDGGDVLVLGRTVFVGASRRTNAAGIEVLGRIAFRAGHSTVPVEVDRGLHLKSAVNRLDDRTVLVAPGFVDPRPFAGRAAVAVAAGEDGAANVVDVPGTNAVIVPDGYPHTAQILEAAGFEPVAVDVSEFERADGGLTCLSVRW